ncbi:ATP-binding protein [Mycolicibacter senuensis]|uniref:Guanylate cyclase domain-containing protein n=1 Tax=Mycolicibacter senuensis TaxID=386913 RepID=A0A7I9XIF9_9MYCO|nr:adenylate/guanylate cyclase domain-containing protein [Mycolicibacter senuensis]MDQ2628796.1 AAA family ATPase [Actinomycetota bacterium]ORW70837.1 cyclase [Mycolicibacter senuensis]GFG69755.1 hypothetical protein MSEN_14750 [Mycolicibacter senuensis]
MTATPACATCGTEPRSGARFCDGCGSPIAPAGNHAEYKQVTVLFADVVHSMQIAAAVGTERLREIMTDLVARTAAVVQRFGGTVDKFTGDGIMAIFGAPVALEDHAVRACLAALGVQEQARGLAEEVREHDAVDLRLRVGINSGEVIVGDIGSGAPGYTAVGEQVGMAQRMESVAPPGGVMLSAATAQLVAAVSVLGEPESVRIKGVGNPVPAQRLLSMIPRRRRDRSAESLLVGREPELTELEAMLGRAVNGRGSAVCLVGSAGIGKTRLVDEVVQCAKDHGVEVFSAFCEAHTTDVAFHVVAGLLGAAARTGGVDDNDMRATVRARVPDADPEDMLLLDDLLGIVEPGTELPKIDPDARRRRLTALINTAQLARTHPAIFVVEDVHWVDEVSESMLTDFLSVIADTCSLVLITCRPEYRGPLLQVPGVAAMSLEPLDDRQTSLLVAELLGTHRSVTEVAGIIAEHSAGNPLFAEEITRELAQRGVLVGDRGDYLCRTAATEIHVPATLQATLAARIDRLGATAKQTLAAAAVIGSRFSRALLAGLGVDPCVDELVSAELIEPLPPSTPDADYAFQHPLIRMVAYEAQLKSGRAEVHRRLAAALESRDPAAADQNAALIAEHWEAAGEHHSAYGWQLRAAAWALNRDITAARMSWERAQKIADTLPADAPNRTAMRIAPRTMLCGIAWRAGLDDIPSRFEELRALCDADGDKPSLAIAMAGLVIGCVYQDRVHQASELASETMALLDSIGDPALTVGLSFAAIYAKTELDGWDDVAEWSQRVIDLADGDPTKGSFLLGCPLAVVLAERSIARWRLGYAGWRDDQQCALAMARDTDPLSFVVAVAFTYQCGIAYGVLHPDDATVRTIEEALSHAERSGDDYTLAKARQTLGFALLHRPTAGERRRGQQILAEVRGVGEFPITLVLLARERARHGEREHALPLIRTIADQLVRGGQLLGWGFHATNVLVETLLEGATATDLAEAEAAIELLATAPAEENLAIRDIWLLRLQALLARARDNTAQYADFRDRYRGMAETLGFEGHLAWAEAMP